MMYELIEFIKSIGGISLDTFWFPILIWTACCAIAFLFLKTQERLHPLFHYHLRTAALLSLPLGIGISAVMSKIPDWFASSNLETAFFIVQNPIEIVPTATPAAGEMAAINWQEPLFFVGAFTVIIALISIYMLGRLASHYISLKRLYKNLNLTNLQEVSGDEVASKKSSIKLAFHDHPLVPFTFGWKQPVIVLPKLLQQEPEKFNMALQHELTHIKRGDYLLQLALSMIESLFWFHPLIRYGNQEIDTYREISCDQEVLSKSDFSIKSYANLLYELVPLNTGVGKLSVSMAVKNSTLKKRIKTMKYHKLHKASFRQSVFFLFLMILGITLPIACSDLRGPQGLSEQELINTSLDIGKATLTVNGKEIYTYPENSLGDPPTLNNGIALSAKEYGTLLLSGTQFEGATQTASVSGNTIKFNLNELSFEITKPNGEFIESGARLWVRHFPKKVPATFSYGTIPYSLMKSGDFEQRMIPDTKQNISNDGDFFIVVEKMPKLIDGMAAIQAKVQYPEMARRAGIEGRVTIQFIVNEQGDVENAKVVKGIGGGADEEALKVVKQAKFEPGVQRGRPVRVRYALSINFRLEDSDFTAPPVPPMPDEPNGPVKQQVNVIITNNDNGRLQGIVKNLDGEPLAGANIMANGKVGAVTNTNGEFTFNNVEAGTHNLKVSYVGYKTKSLTVTAMN
jgi:TonB family protein